MKDLPREILCLILNLLKFNDLCKCLTVSWGIHNVAVGCNKYKRAKVLKLDNELFGGGECSCNPYSEGIMIRFNKMNI